MHQHTAKTIICNLLGVVLAATLAAHAYARDVRSILARELVEESGQRYVHERVNRCRMQLPESSAFGDPGPMIVMRHIEAPVDLMSRDRFVSLSTALLMRNRIALAHLLAPGIGMADAFSAVHCRPIEGYDGSIDFHVAVSMDESGIRIETTDRGSGNSAVDRISWEEMLNLPAKESSESE